MIGSSKRCGSRALSAEVETPLRLRLLRCVVLIGAVALSAPPIAAAQEAQVGEQEQPGQAAEVKPEQSWYASSLSRNEAGSFLVVHFWSKGARFRAETLIAGHRITSIVNGGTYYVLDPVLGTGAAIERSQRSVAQDATRGRPFGGELQQILSQGGEKVGTERVGGRECEMYRVTNAKGRRQVCLSMQEPQVPLRIESFDRNSGQTTYVDYSNWMLGLLISDAFFEPDERISMERLGYEEYQARTARGQSAGPAPVLYGDLLHGHPD